MSDTEGGHRWALNWPILLQTFFIVYSIMYWKVTASNSELLYLFRSTQQRTSCGVPHKDVGHRRSLDLAASLYNIVLQYTASCAVKQMQGIPSCCTFLHQSRTEPPLKATHGHWTSAFIRGSHFTAGDFIIYCIMYWTATASNSKLLYLFTSTKKQTSCHVTPKDVGHKW